jgi:mRNA (guanine-N7-)-methyltransferase
VGRGGDIFKWHKCDIPNVIGVDIDTEYINEANRRYKSSEIFSNEYKYSFHVVKHDDILHELYEHDKFNVVSCQFAIHYFFKSKERLHQMLHDVTLLLKPDGYFIGTFMNGTKVLQLIQNGTCDFMNKAMLIHSDQIIKEPSFGNEIKVHLIDTLYFGDDSVSTEYLVIPEILKQECEHFGFELIEIKSFEQYYHTMHKTFKLDRDHQTCSYLYSTFVFKLKK